MYDFDPNTAAEIRHLDTHVRDRHAEQVRDLGADEERMLTCRPERDLVALVLRDHRVRLHCVLVDRWEGVLALDDDVCVPENCFDLAAEAGSGNRRCRRAAAASTEPVKEPRFCLALDHERCAGRDCVVYGGDHRQFVVLDDDRLDRGGSGSGRLGCDRRDLLTMEAHLVDRDDRPIFDRVPVVRVDVLQVPAGENTDNAGDAFRRRRVDRDDAAMRDWAPQDPPVQHPRHDHVADELRLPAKLLLRVAARFRGADLCAGRRLTNDGGHSTPARSATASMMPR